MSLGCSYVVEEISIVVLVVGELVDGKELEDGNVVVVVIDVETWPPCPPGSVVEVDGEKEDTGRPGACPKREEVVPIWRCEERDDKEGNRTEDLEDELGSYVEDDSFFVVDGFEDKFVSMFTAKITVIMAAHTHNPTAFVGLEGGLK